jgi:valyl-tRNA synthetase
VYQSPAVVGTRIPAGMMMRKICCSENEEEAKSKFKSQNLNPEGQLRQDEDVLDTWFSSWLWPIEVFQWNNSTQ